MKVLKMNILALMLSAVGASACMSAIAMATSPEHIEQRIEVIAENNEDAKVVVDIDGEVHKLTIPAGALADEDRLRDVLSRMPDDVQDKLFNVLRGLSVDENVVKFVSDDNSVVLFEIDKELGDVGATKDAENVFVFKMGGSVKESSHRIVQHMRSSDKHKVIKFKDAEHAFSDVIINLLSQSEFSQEELDKIQTALDAKR